MVSTSTAWIEIWSASIDENDEISPLHTAEIGPANTWFDTWNQWHICNWWSTEIDIHIIIPMTDPCMYGRLMLTWLGYIDGKCYHIWHTYGSYGIYNIICKIIWCKIASWHHQHPNKTSMKLLQTPSGPSDASKIPWPLRDFRNTSFWGRSPSRTCSFRLAAGHFLEAAKLVVLPASQVNLQIWPKFVHLSWWRAYFSWTHWWTAR